MRTCLSVLAVCLVLFFSSCTKKSSVPNGHKLLFIGVDAMDWEMVNLLRSQGRLPHLDRLISRACTARIDTREPGNSALYWTTVATGQVSAKHGIKDFVVEDPQTRERRPYTSNMRKTKAFWNIFSERGISVGVSGWYVTWPVEKVNGFMVSSYLSMRRKQPNRRGTIYSQARDMVYPPSLEKDMPRLLEQARAKYESDITRIMPPSTLTTKKRGMSWRKVVSPRWAFMADLIYAQVGSQLARDMRPQVMAYYFGGIDEVGHLFTRPDPKAHQDVIAEFGDVQTSYYLYLDELVAGLVDQTDPRTIIIISSDHGLMRGEHTTNGVFIMAGPDIKKGVRLSEPVYLVDLCPTMLYLMGLPAAADMDGRVAIQAVDEAYSSSHRVRTVRSYGPRKTDATRPRSSNFDRQIVERLKSLGYLK